MEALIHTGRDSTAFAHADVDTALMVEASRRSPHAFGTLVQRNRQALIHFFSHQGASGDSEDLVQETFIRLFQYRERYQPTAKFSSFLYTIARHAWADHGRKVQRREHLAELYELEAALSLSSCPVDACSGFDLEAALATLSAKLREVVDLYFYQGLRYQDIASRLNVPLGTVKSRMSLAVKALREQYDLEYSSEYPARN